MKKYKLTTLLGCLLLFMFSGCGDDWLDTEPESFFGPETAFRSPEGIEAMLISMRKALRDNDWGNNARIRSEYYFTDISYMSLQNAGSPRNANVITPFANAFQMWTQNTWEESYEVIRDANIVINRIDLPTYENEAQRNALLAEAFFHRAYWYYRLVHRFGDVPWIGQEITSPRVDFFSFTREAILNKIKEDMEWAVQHLREDVIGGQVSKGAGDHLLTKLYLSVGEFDNAIASASRVIDGGKYSLMTERFGSGPFAGDPNYDVLWDLHQRENKDLNMNTEAILIAVDEFEAIGRSGNNGSLSDRYWMPLWWLIPGCEYNVNNGIDELEEALNRGVSWARPNNYFNYTLKAEDPNDRRYSETNWWSLDDFWYNDPTGANFGQTIDIADVGLDSISRMFEFPYYKLHVPADVLGQLSHGGTTDFYVYRLAETYLLRAEAHMWKGDVGSAAADVNVVRARAGASQKSGTDMSMDYIFDERARELYTEEKRWTELARVSYTMALLNRDGYSLETMHERNYYHDKITRTNDIFDSGVVYTDQEYDVQPYNVYWPVPQVVIDANSLGHINQNLGYTGAQSNVDPITVITDED